MLVFDPIMGDLEKALLVKLGCDVLVRNEEGKRCCGSGTTAEKEASSRGDRQTRPTLFFMPHCPQRLYSNVLWANWSSAGKRKDTITVLLRGTVKIDFSI